MFDGQRWRGGMNRANREDAIETAKAWAAENELSYRVFSPDGKIIFDTDVGALDVAEIPAEVIEAMRPAAPASPEEVEALRRLIRIARSDTGQAGRVADFLLAWWNAESCGSFDMTNLWAVDTALARDMVAVFGLVARVHEYPDKIDSAFEADFADIVRRWRPDLADR